MKRTSISLIFCVVGLTGCSSLGEAVGMPFAVLDGVVLIATLGTVDPGLGLTVQKMVDEGELNSYGSINSYDPDLAAAVLPVAAEAAGQYALAKQQGAEYSAATQTSGANSSTYLSSPAPTLYASAGSGSVATSSAAGNTKIFRTATDCVHISNDKSQSYSAVVNDCSYPVFVSYFDDSGRRGVAFGTGGITPGKHELILRINGSARYGACEYPASPKQPEGGTWGGVGVFECRQG